jgi:DNA-directed RNA polymerase specialized sigma24 family protein
MAFALRKLHDFDYEGIGRLLRCPSQSAQAAVTQAFRKVSRMRPMRSALASVITTQPAIEE